MKKVISLMSVSLFALCLQAQVGINTNTPQATLDIEVKNTNGSTAEGLLVPRLTGNQLALIKPSNINIETSTIVYVTEAATVTSSYVEGVTTTGFYYYNGTEWVPFTSNNAEPWNTVGTPDNAAANNEDIYQEGKVAVGFTSSDTFGEVGGDQTTMFEVKKGDAIINELTLGKGNSNIDSNTAIGKSTLKANTTGAKNTAVGTQSLYSNTTGNNNSSFGYMALLNNTTGNNNVAVGQNALRDNTADYNTAVGTAALRYNSTGRKNTAIGASALHANTTGNYNTAVGTSALDVNTTGAYNTALGEEALMRNIVGKYNVAVGVQALINNTANQNTAVGRRALANNTTGAYNTAIGYQAMEESTTGSRNIAIGYEAEVIDGTADNQLVIGSTIYGEQIYDKANLRIGIGTDSPSYTLDVNGEVRATAFNQSSDRRLKEDIADIKTNVKTITEIRPVEYVWNVKGKEKGGDDKKHLGFIAQEIEKVLPSLVQTDEEGYKSVNYIEVIPVLTKAIQEQQKEIEELKIMVKQLLKK